MGDRNREFESAIGTPLIDDLVDKNGKLGITVAILLVNRFAVF